MQSSKMFVLTTVLKVEWWVTGTSSLSFIQSAFPCWYYHVDDIISSAGAKLSTNWLWKVSAVYQQQLELFLFPDRNQEIWNSILCVTRKVYVVRGSCMCSICNITPRCTVLYSNILHWLYITYIYRMDSQQAWVTMVGLVCSNRVPPLTGTYP